MSSPWFEGDELPDRCSVCGVKTADLALAADRFWVCRPCLSSETESVRPLHQSLALDIGDDGMVRSVGRYEQGDRSSQSEGGGA